MKLRLRDNTVRLRLTQSEVARLASEGAVEAATQIGPVRFMYALRRVERESRVRARLDGGRLEVVVPVAEALTWCASDRVGLTADEGPTRIVIEKDFACLKRRAVEEDADAFPNPGTRSEPFPVRLRI